MSWDDYITKNLMAPLDANGVTLTSAAILGLDGSVWAQSTGFPEISPENFDMFTAAMADPSITTVFIGADKYIKMPSGDNVLRARKQGHGFIARKTYTAMIIGFFTEPTTDARRCSSVVESLAEYLETQGF